MAIGAITNFWRLLALVVAAAALLVSAGPAAERAAAGSACTKYGDVKADKLRNRQARAAIRCFLNRARKQRGLSKLDRNSRLQRAAQRHNETMMDKGVLLAPVPGRGLARDAASQRRVPHRRAAAWTYGENIAYGGEQHGTPKAISKAWMKSPGHRANILNRTSRTSASASRPASPATRTPRRHLHHRLRDAPRLAARRTYTRRRAGEV